MLLDIVCRQLQLSRPPRSSDDWGPDPVASAYHGAEVKTGPYSSWPQPPGNHTGPPPASVIANAMAQLDGQMFEVCPTCHFKLPDGRRDGQAICVAMAGARATGKSLYTAVLVKQLEMLCVQLGVSMEPVNRATAASYEENYEKWLFIERGLIPATSPMHTQTSLQREPLVYSIGTWQGVRRVLSVLRDVAGEDMESGDLQHAGVHVLLERGRGVLHVRPVAGEVDPRPVAGSAARPRRSAAATRALC